MVAKFQLGWVSVEIILLLEIRFLVFTNIMIHKSNWHDKRHIMISGTLNYFKQFLFLIAGKHFFKLTHHVHKNIDMLFHSRLEFHGRHQILLIGGEKVFSA